MGFFYLSFVGDEQKNYIIDILLRIFKFQNN